jgi:putative selenate reductase
MSDKFFPLPLLQLLELAWGQLSGKDSYFGIPRELFHTPDAPSRNPLGTQLFGTYLDNPLGVAAGPHSQLAQNIIGAWLMGARYIELKTVQTLDELEVPKPCIDMQDEGYNCEWSQELKIRQSFDEYLNAWIAIHLLNHKLGWEKHPGTIFNMSVGYNLEGIKQENVQWFFRKMADCSEELQGKKSAIRAAFPEIDDVDIPVRISDNITLSTMHGCPANEIEAIACYLMEEKNLHTYVKLNPTLLGPDRLREILNTRLGFRTSVPDQAFAHDLKYPDAVRLIQALREVGLKTGRDFGLKLTNTLESNNNKDVFGESVDQMYMSGRALHPLSINLAARLQHDFDGQLALSFSGGVDAFNIRDVLACGFRTVTVCTDILKPGGYMRLKQYLDNMRQEPREYASAFLQEYAASVLGKETYKRTSLVDPDIKTARELGPFDCISAPCRDTCATNQDIPDYMCYTSRRNYDGALSMVLRTNPFPSVTGMVCDHLCQNKCTRVHYDESLKIREVKRFLAENGEATLTPEYSNGLEVAVIGAGPAGLSCAYFLALAGFSVDVYESHPKAGGMVQYAIPGFRLTDEAIEKDLQRISSLGVRIHYNSRVDQALFRELQTNMHYVFIGAGAQLAATLELKGMDAGGVVDPLSFLMRVKSNEPAGIGKNVLIIGGGNTAMDAARTAFRLVGEDGSVRVVYRRTIREMPADQGEIKAVLEEGVEILELTAPMEILTENGRVSGLRCVKMRLSDADDSGRPRPVKVDGSDFELQCDTVIPAVGQALDIDFVDTGLLEADTSTYVTRMDNVFIGGDALRGASTAINAIGDGRKAAEQIMRKAIFDFHIDIPSSGHTHSITELMIRRATRQFARPLYELPADDRRHFRLIQHTINEEDAVAEAGRCLFCDELCNICTTVCPNFANFAYEILPEQISLRKAWRKGAGNAFTTTWDEDFEVFQKVQILNIADFCNECGNCTTFCPTSSAPFLVKPKLHLSKDAFDEAREGYYMTGTKEQQNLTHKKEGRMESLTETPSGYVYTTPEYTALLDKDDFNILNVEFLLSDGVEVRLRQAAMMKIIMQGASALVFP